VDYLPKSDCGSCIAGNCTEFARKIRDGEAQIAGCSRMMNPEYCEELKELQEFLAEATLS
jgi:CO dehydrogenase/acetyl-CoA synthase gamma subunit (corrinoid Fe-S protein)